MGNHTSATLLEHGLRVAKVKGFRGIVVREVARAAGVNTGSFVYHFRSRNDFLAELVRRWYEPLARKIAALAAEPKGSAYDRLEAVTIGLIRLVASESPLIAHLVMDAAAGEKAAQAFLMTVPADHPKVLLALIRRAQADGDLVLGDPANLGHFLVGSAWYPLLMSDGVLRDRSWVPSFLEDMIVAVRDADAAVERLQWALAGLRAR